MDTTNDAVASAPGARGCLGWGEVYFLKGTRAKATSAAASLRVFFAPLCEPFFATENARCDFLIFSAKLESL